MNWFRKKEKTVDWTENYVRQKDRLQNLKEGVAQTRTPESSAPVSAGNFNFLANLASSASASQTSSYTESSDSDENNDDKKRRLVKRLTDMTEKIEELSTQIYHLQQRVELLERKNKSGFE